MTQRPILGGASYSEGAYNPWPWLDTQTDAEAMASEVSQWPSQYGCDGIDLDIETGAGDSDEAAANLVAFVVALKQLAPNLYVGQPVFGYPTVLVFLCLRPSAKDQRKGKVNESICTCSWGWGRLMAN